jgi:hypothetical protein
MIRRRAPAIQAIPDPKKATDPRGARTITRRGGEAPTARVSSPIADGDQKRRCIMVEIKAPWSTASQIIDPNRGTSIAAVPAAGRQSIFSSHPRNPLAIHPDLRGIRG